MYIKGVYELVFLGFNSGFYLFMPYKKLYIPVDALVLELPILLFPDVLAHTIVLFVNHVWNWLLPNALFLDKYSKS